MDGDSALLIKTLVIGALTAVALKVPSCVVQVAVVIALVQVTR